MMSSDIILVIIALIFPPAAAFFITGCSIDLFINILLTMLGYFPGFLHAFWLIYVRSKAEQVYGPHGFQYIGNGQFRGKHGTGSAEAQPAKRPGPLPETQPDYGTTTTATTTKAGAPEETQPATTQMPVPEPQPEQPDTGTTDDTGSAPDQKS